MVFYIVLTMIIYYYIQDYTHKNDKHIESMIGTYILYRVELEILTHCKMQ